MLSLFVPVHVKSLPTVKFIQILLKITSIFPNFTLKGHPMSKVIQFKDHEVNWKIIYVYDFLYVFHVWHLVYIQSPPYNGVSAAFWATLKGDTARVVMTAYEY